MEVLQLRYVRLDGSTGKAMVCASPRAAHRLDDAFPCPRRFLPPSAVDERLATVDRFNHNDDVFAFLLSTRAGGQGLNLTGADTVILHGARSRGGYGRKLARWPSVERSSHCVRALQMSTSIPR